LLCENIDSWAKKGDFLHTGVGECLLDKGVVRVVRVNLGDLNKEKINQKRSAPEKVGKNE
jgi:hypothetical protein